MALLAFWLCFEFGPKVWKGRVPLAASVFQLHVFLTCLVQTHSSTERRLGLIVRTSAVMNIYSGINAVVEITTLRLADAKRLHSAPLMGINPNLSLVPGSYLPWYLCLFWTDNTLFLSTLAALPVHYLNAAMETTYLANRSSVSQIEVLEEKPKSELRISVFRSDDGLPRCAFQRGRPPDCEVGSSSHNISPRLLKTSIISSSLTQCC